MRFAAVAVLLISLFAGSSMSGQRTKRSTSRRILDPAKTSASVGHKSAASRSGAVPPKANSAADQLAKTEHQSLKRQTHRTPPHQAAALSQDRSPAQNRTKRMKLSHQRRKG